MNPTAALENAQARYAETLRAYRRAAQARSEAADLFRKAEHRENVTWAEMETALRDLERVRAEST